MSRRAKDFYNGLIEVVPALVVYTSDPATLSCRCRMHAGTPGALDNWCPKRFAMAPRWRPICAANATR